MLVSGPGCTWIDAVAEMSERHYPEFRRVAEALCADRVSLSTLPHHPALSMTSGLSSIRLPEP